MVTLPVVDTENNQVGTVDCSGAVFCAPLDVSLVHQVVVMQRACSRQGTAATRGRGAVNGSGKKPWKQKHTGRARSGSVRSPLWRHGGVVFGPQPRDYSYHLPRKVYRAALRSALSSKVLSGDVMIISELEFDGQKTRLFSQFLSRLGLSGHILFVVGGEWSHLLRMTRNIKQLTMVPVSGLTVYDLVRADKVVIVRSQISKIQEFWA